MNIYPKIKKSTQKYKWNKIEFIYDIFQQESEVMLSDGNFTTYTKIIQNQQASNSPFKILKREK